MHILGVIPARGGKQQVPGKNTRSLLGKPLIGYTIEAAQQSRLIDRLVVSTEDAVIAEVASSFEVEIVNRPVELAREDSPLEPSLRHAVKFLADKDGYQPDIVVLMQANVPIRKPGMMDQVIQTLIDNEEADSACSIYAVDQWPQWMKIMNKEGFLTPFMKVETAFRRQDLEQTYLLDGAVLAIHKSVLDRTVDHSGAHNYLGEKIKGVLQESVYSIEIDNKGDFLFAEAVLKTLA